MKKLKNFIIPLLYIISIIYLTLSVPFIYYRGLGMESIYGKIIGVLSSILIGIIMFNGLVKINITKLPPKENKNNEKE